MKFDLICWGTLWVLPVVLGLLSVRVTGVKKGKLVFKYRFGDIGAIIFLSLSFLLIFMLLIMGDMRDWDRFHQMTIMSHGGVEVFKWMVKIFFLTICLFALFSLLHITSCAATEEFLNYLYQERIIGFKRRRSRLVFGLLRRRRR